MAFKTVQTLDISYPLDLTPDLDRFYHQDSIVRGFLMDLIDRGELPRHRGSEVEFQTTADHLIITMHWGSKEVAQEYADFCNAHQPAEYVKNPIEVVEY